MDRVECDGGQPSPSQHPAAADFRSDRLLCCCSAGRGVLNVPLSWQPLPQCWHTFLEDYCSRSSTSFPVALSAHLLRHDCYSSYLWLLFAIFSSHFLYNFFLFSLLFFRADPLSTEVALALLRLTKQNPWVGTWLESRLYFCLPYLTAPGVQMRRAAADSAVFWHTAVGEREMQVCFLSIFSGLNAGAGRSTGWPHSPNVEVRHREGECHSVCYHA